MSDTTLFARLLGDALVRLDTPVRHLHRGISGEYRGRATVERGGSWLVNRFCDGGDLPRGVTDAPLRFRLDVDGNTETWTRYFAGSGPMASRVAAVGGLLREQLGPAYPGTVPSTDSRSRRIWRWWDCWCITRGCSMSTDRVLIYDGHCHQCSGWARSLHRHPVSPPFRLVAMQSEEGRVLLTAHGIDAEDPSTFLVLDAGQAWCDALYRLLARNCYRWFGRREVCYLPGGES